MKSRIRKTVEATWPAIKIVGAGVSPISLSLIHSPKAMVHYCSECLFTYKALTGSKRLQEKSVFEILRRDGVIPVLLGNLHADGVWFRREASYTVDLIQLCIICQLVQPMT